MNAYFENANVRYSENIRVREHDFGERFIGFVCALVGMLTCSAAVKIEKTMLVFGLFVSFIAVIGAIESGMLSMLLGILLCGGISLAEYTILKGIFKPVKKE